MKFNFKIQQYQTDAVDAVVKVFNGQGFHDKISYIRDLGKMKSADMQMTLEMTDEEMELYDSTNDTGYKNELVELSDEQLLHNLSLIHICRCRRIERWTFRRSPYARKKKRSRAMGGKT